MGGITSKRVDETPQQEKRLLHLDPRSPTEGITRTPIMVDVTPMQTTKTPPQPSSMLAQILDPRSPADNFNRTSLVLPPPIKFDFAELEQALQEQLKALEASASPKPLVEEAPTPPTTPLKARVPKAMTPLALRSPNVKLNANTNVSVNANGDSKACVREPELKHTPAPKSRLRHVAHQNQAKKRGVVQDENSPRPIRL